MTPSPQADGLHASQAATKSPPTLPLMVAIAGGLRTFFRRLPLLEIPLHLLYEDPAAVSMSHADFYCGARDY